MGSTLLALDARLDLERNFAGIRDWAFRFDTAKPECILCFASVQVKDNRRFLLERKASKGFTTKAGEGFQRTQRRKKGGRRNRRGWLESPPRQGGGTRKGRSDWGRIFRLSGGWEHGIVSPPGNRDTTEFPRYYFEGQVYECAVEG